MSKKNRNKNKMQENKSPVESSPAKTSSASKPDDGKDADLRREFKNLALTILFILALLAALYYFDQKDQILARWTDEIFALF
jgi:hypothetical protein